MLSIPKYLNEIIGRSYEEGVGLRTITLRTPSVQFWARLSKEQQDEWKRLIIELGADPEDYLRHMRAMLPEGV